MAILSLKSTNPDFSYVLQKNPATGMLIKEIRQGKCFGWYSGDQIYNLYFKDGDDEVSYKQHVDEEFEYQNVSRYNSALFIQGVIGEYFRSASKKRDPKDVDGFENSAFINMIYIKREHRLRLFAEHFTDYKLDYTEIANKNFQLTVTTNKSMYELLNFINLFCTFTALANGDNIWVDDVLRQKYLDCLNVLDAPYFVRYMFKLNLLTDGKSFKLFKPLLEKSHHHKIEMEFGDTGLMRRTKVQEHLDFNKPIIDIGCGEGFYAFPFSKKLDQHTYHAIDIDPEVLEGIQKKAKRKEVKNLAFYPGFDKFVEETVAWEDAGVSKVTPKSFDALMVEVIEHMPLEEAKDFVRKVLDFKGLNKLIVTTPNKEFNKFYAFEEEDMRHDDHKFELNRPDFEDFVILDVLFKIAGEDYKSKFKVEFFDMGDIVNGITPTQGVIIEKL